MHTGADIPGPIGPIYRGIGLDCIGLVWIVLYWIVLDCIGLVWIGLDRFGLCWIVLAWIGLVWIGLVWIGLVWIVLVWIGLVWFGRPAQFCGSRDPAVEGGFWWLSGGFWPGGDGSDPRFFALVRIPRGPWALRAGRDPAWPMGPSARVGIPWADPPHPPPPPPHPTPAPPKI